MRTLIVIIALCLSAFGQNWSGVLDPARAIDWSNAGASHINDVRTQCGATIPAGASAATINAAINSCSNGYVLLGPGNFSVASLTFNHKSDITLRGSGSNSTFITFTGGGTCLGGGGHNICADSSDINYFAGPSNTANWTGTNGSAGTYTRGATSITLSSITNLKVGSPIILDQLDDQTDNGSLYVGCEIGDGSSACYVNAGPNGYERGSGLLTTIRGQQQIVNVVDCRTDHSTARGAACNVTGITITPGIYAANWQTSHSPGAWWATNPVFNDAVENLSITEGAGDGIDFVNCTGCWVKGVRAVRTTTTGGAYFHVNFFMSNHGTARDSYFFGFDGDSYQITSSIASDLLVENNIIQRPGGVAFNSDCEGCVIAYNYYVNPTANTTTTLSASFIDHGIKLYLLDEGNIGTGQYLDSFHGTHDLSTVFRTVASGEDRNNGVLTNGWGSFPLWFNPGTRYQNAIGNVLGTAGYHDTYMVKPGQTSGNPIINAGIYPGQTATDALSSSTSMFWGNWDSVTNAVRWNANEVPSSGLPASNAYANTLPADHNLPNSFYLSSKPSWIPASKPWPLIGPEVTGGNVGQCVGGTMSASHCTATSQCTGGGSCSLVASGRAYSSPAMDCYLTTMGGAASGNVTTPYAFDASTCYSAVAPPTFTLSGTVSAGAGSASPNPGVTVSCPACTPTSTTTDGAGAYSFGLENGGSNYTLTPSKTGYTFSPASTTFNNLAANQMANFTGFQAPVPSCSPSGGIFKSGRLINCTNAISAATICWRIGSPPTTSSGTCTAGTTYIAPFMVSATGTLFVTGTQSGNTDSSTSYSFTINPTWTTGWIMNSPTVGRTTFGGGGISWLGATRRDIVQPPTTPDLGVLTKNNAIVHDTSFGQPSPPDIARCTDANFDSSNLNRLFFAGLGGSGSATGLWNANSTALRIENGGGTAYLTIFDPVNMTCSAPLSPVVSAGSFDWNDPTVWYNATSILRKYTIDFAAKTLTPGATIADWSLGIPYGTNAPAWVAGKTYRQGDYVSKAYPAIDWQANFAYATLGDIITPSVGNPAGCSFKLDTAGTSAASHTSTFWSTLAVGCVPASNGTLLDGTAKWRDLDGPAVFVYQLLGAGGTSSGSFTLPTHPDLMTNVSDGTLGPWRNVGVLATLAWTDFAGASRDGTRFCEAGSTNEYGYNGSYNVQGNQDTGQWAICFDSARNEYELLNTATGWQSKTTFAGGVWTMAPMGQVTSLSTCGLQLHNGKGSTGLDYVIYTRKSAMPPGCLADIGVGFWQPFTTFSATTSWQIFPLMGTSHWVPLHHTFVNLGQNQDVLGSYAAGVYDEIADFRNPSAPYQTSWQIKPCNKPWSPNDPNPPCTMGDGYDHHLSGAYDPNDTDDSPVCGSMYNFATASPIPVAPWQGEEVCVSTTPRWTDIANPSANQTVFRFTHTFNSGTNSSFSGQFTASEFSTDGRFLAWVSDWRCGLGSSTGGTVPIAQVRCGLQWVTNTIYPIDTMVNPFSSNGGSGTNFGVWRVTTQGNLSGRSGTVPDWTPGGLTCNSTNVGITTLDGNNMQYTCLGSSNARTDVFVVRLRR